MKASYLNQVIGYFDPMQSLDEKHKAWYVDRPDSPEEEIKIYLLNNGTDTKILFSGHRGSGKSSTLSKLACDPAILKAFFVVKFSIKDELNVADLTYTDLLLAIGHRLYEEGKGWLSAKLSEDLDRWSAEVSQVTTTTDGAEAKVQAGIGVWFLKATGILKTAFEEKTEFRKKLDPRVSQLIDFINRIIGAIETHPDAGGREVLVILEDLDKPTRDVALDLFAVKGSVLAEPQCKIIFTVPTSLLYSGQFNVAKQSFSEQFMLPNFKIKETTGERSDAGWAKMREIVHRRMESPLIQSTALDLAVEMSGGVVRELVRIIEGAATRALVAKANVIKHEHVEQAVEKLRAEYSFSLTREEYVEILRRVHETHKLMYPKEGPLLDLLHNLFILQYPNGPGWYGVNPIVHKLIGV
jgi:hypothetical protein